MYKVPFYNLKAINDKMPYDQVAKSVGGKIKLDGKY